MPLLPYVVMQQTLRLSSSFLGFAQRVRGMVQNGENEQRRKPE